MTGANLIVSPQLVKRNYIEHPTARSVSYDHSAQIEPHEPRPLLFLFSTCLTVNLNMKNRTDTLEIGSAAPGFSLAAANREGMFTLDSLLAQGLLVLEFLRGTW